MANFQSKRKTPTSISFYKNERMFGSDSIALQGRKPELTFSKMYRALGRVDTHHHINEITKEQYFPHIIYRNETTGFTHVTVEETSYTPEELIAMMLQHAKDMTVNFGGKKIKDCVVTVPAFFTQHERRALYTAASIAELNILSLVEENTAAALHYGIDRTFDAPTNVLYYNFGAGSVQVSIATYSSYMVKEGGKNKTIGQFEIVGKAWDSSLGGFNFDVKLAELLATRFNEAWSKKAHGKGKDVRDFTRPMTRLRIEANKIKEILSANMEYPIKAEQLHADVDLVTKITRADYEAACEDLFNRMTLPIDAALAMANLTLADINSVELLGGGVRTPKVKRILEDYFRPAKLDLGQHLNGDEAMALGAAFRGANLSTAFRVRKVGLSDMSPFGITVALNTLPVEPASEGLLSSLFNSVVGNKKSEAAATTVAAEGDEAKPAAADVWSKSVDVFPRKTTTPSKTKILTFPYDKDILCRVSYSEENPFLPAGTNSLLALYNITGITAFSLETAAKYPNASQPRVHLSFVLGDDGVVVLQKAEVSSELPLEMPDVETGKIEGEASAPANVTSEEAAAASSSSTTDNENTTDTTSSSADKEKEKDKKKKKDSKVKKDSLLRRLLKVTENTEEIKPAVWSAEHIASARTRLHALQAADDARRAKESALNDLEAYVLKVKNKLADDEDNWKKVSTEEQRQEVIDLANAAEEWIYEDGRDAGVSDYKSKQTDVKKKAEAIFHRYSELTARPKAVAKAHDILKLIKSKIEQWKKPESSHITENEIDSLIAAGKKAEDWLETKQEAQLALSNFEKPAFDSDAVVSIMEPVGTLFKKLSERPIPVSKKVSYSCHARS